ncbi:MAG: SDR family oxidoreductase [Chloroflexota bacterium]|nr:SDR family oxidoreductase [Chloroflexota bacterium]
MAARRALRRARRIDLHGQLAVITGGSRGLGLALACELAREGCRIVLSARDAGELQRARQQVESLGGEVMVVQCDVSERVQVANLIAESVDRFGQIDILVNNAGAISVGPVETQTLEDFERAMATMFWGTVYPTFEVLPQMRQRRAGHIVNITSVGGKISVPHLGPYSAAKFAAVGFSEGLNVELGAAGIHVLTVVPGLMRTGSHVNAEFKGQHRREFAWFSLAASLPITSIAADQAARQIVSGIKTGESEVILTWQAALATRVHGLMPGVTAQVLTLVERLLPTARGEAQQAKPGWQSRGPLSDSRLTALGENAADDLNQR